MAGGGLENRIAQAVFGIPGVKGIEFGDGFAAGEPITFRVAMKPTSSIAIEQDSVNLQTGENARLRVQGRHDPCIVPRAVPCVEAAAALAVYDALLAR